MAKREEAVGHPLISGSLCLFFCCFGVAGVSSGGDDTTTKRGRGGSTLYHYATQQFCVLFLLQNTPFLHQSRTRDHSLQEVRKIIAQIGNAWAEFWYSLCFFLSPFPFLLFADSENISIAKSRPLCCSAREMCKARIPLCTLHWNISSSTTAVLFPF